MSAATPAYRADGRDCSEQAFYAAACDARRSAIVEACAGAGKTWLLVSRIVRALLDGAAPGEILAITFTRKAAGEMRLRLHDWLREFAAATVEQRVVELQARGLDAEAAHALEPTLAALHARVLASGDGVQVHTFHAWFAQLLRVAPLEALDALGVHPAMALIEEVDEHHGELMRRFQRAVLEAPALLQDYRALIERHGRRTLERWLRAALDKRLEIQRADACDALEDAVEPAARRWADCAAGSHPLQRLAGDSALRSQLGAAIRQLQARAGKVGQDAAAKLASALDTKDGAAAFALARDALFTREGAPRKLGDLMEVSFAVDAIGRLAEQAAQQDAHDDHRRMVRLARVLLACWRDLKRERALIDMQDLERCALALLSDTAVAGWMQQQLDAQLRHVLIDEFQDTSNLQWQALLGWLSSYAGAGGGASGQQPLSLFIVGDPKQSIYRFRGAEPRVFEAAREFVVEGLGGHDLACNHTRRNAGAVVQAVNAVFEQAVAGGDYTGFAPHSTERAAEPGEVWHAPDPPADAKPATARRDDWRDSLTEPRHEARAARAQDEARRVAEGVQRLLRQGVTPADVMVLARRRITLAHVADALHALHVPCVAAEELRLADQIEVNDLVAVLDVLVSPGNDLALAQALKSPLFGAGDADLLALAARVQRHAATPWWSALMHWHDAPPALARARTLLAQWCDDARRLPPHDVLDRVVHQGDLMARLAAAVPADRRVTALGAVDALLGLSLALEGGRNASVYRFVRALKQRVLSVPAPARDDAVRLLTVHGVKGLEARCVWLVDTDPNEMRDNEPGVLVDWPVDLDAPRRVAFIADPDAPCASLADLRALEQAAAQREELNALYVAMTRARDMLLFSRTPARRNTGPSWWSRLLPHIVAWPNDTRVSPDAQAKAPQRIAVPDLPRVPAMPAAAALPVGAPSIAARMGRAVHRVLQWSTAAPDGDDFDTWANSATAEFELPAAAARRVAEHARTIRRSPALQRFFDDDAFAWSADEFDVMHDGALLRLDRLVRFGPEHDARWWVLDYKLAHDAAGDPALRGQLRRYRDAVRLLADGAPVHAAFITGDGALHELQETE